VKANTTLSPENIENQTKSLIFHVCVFVQIEKDPKLLPNVSLNLEWEDTHGETIHATKAVSQMICKKVAVFIGPESNTCHTEAIVAQAWNVPMISYVSIL